MPVRREERCPLTLSVSWSGLKRYEECKQKHLRVIQGKSSSLQDGRIFLPGTVADRLCRAWLDQDDPRPGWMAANVETYMEKYAGNDRSTEDARDARLIKWRGNPTRDRLSVTNFVRLVVTNLEPILIDLVLPHDWQAELKFRTVIRIPYLDGRLVPINMIGGIDIISRLRSETFGLAAGDFVNYDLKATKDPSYINKVLGQTIFYDVAFGHYIGDVTQPKRFGFLVPAIPEKVVWVTVSEADRAAMMERIVAFAHGQWRKEWTPKESNSGCNYCEVQHACDKFSAEVYKDEVGRHRVSFDESAAARRAVR